MANMTILAYVTLYIIVVYLSGRGNSMQNNYLAIDKTNHNNYTQCLYSRSSSEEARIPLNIEQFAGVYAFDFTPGNNGAVEDFQFQIHCTTACLIFIWDCFCSGDSFKLELITTNPTFSLNSFNAPAEYYGQCRVYESDPNICLGSAEFFRAIYVMDPGTTLFTIKPLGTLYGGGTGFVWVEGACDGPIFQPCCQYTGTCNLTLANRLDIIAEKSN